MKRLLLRLLLVVAFAGYMKTAASVVHAGEIWQKGETVNAPKDRGAWTKRKQLLQKDLRTAVQEAADAVEEANDANLKTRLGDLDASAKALLSVLETSKQSGELEAMVSELLRNLQFLKSEAQAKSSGMTEKNPDAEKQKLQSRADTALTNAKEALRDTKDKELTVAVEELAAEVKTVKSSIAPAKSAKEIELAGAKVSELEARSQKITNAAAGSWTDSLTSANLLIAVATFLSIVSLIAIALIVFKFADRIRHLELAQGKSRQTLEAMKHELGDARSLAESVAGNLARVQDDLTLQIVSAKRTSEEARRIARLRESAPPGIESLSEPNLEPIAPVDHDPSFPALVSDYLNHIGVTRKRGVEADFRTNTLVQTSDTSAPFMFVAHSDGSDAGIVLPKPRLQRGQEFSSYYKGYYHCAEPSAGNVYIVEPAQVERAGSGWRLRQMGRMEIR
jgi:hypothetical protein